MRSREGTPKRSSVQERRQRKEPRYVESFTVDRSHAKQVHGRVTHLWHIIVAGGILEEGLSTMLAPKTKTLRRGGPNSEQPLSVSARKKQRHGGHSPWLAVPRVECIPVGWPGFCACFYALCALDYYATHTAETMQCQVCGENRR